MNAVKASAPLEMLSTHPANETRVQKLDDLMTYVIYF
jgi:predicted Zn-dependent protease